MKTVCVKYNVEYNMLCCSTDGITAVDMYIMLNLPCELTSTANYTPRFFLHSLCVTGLYLFALVTNKIETEPLFKYQPVSENI